MRKNIFILAISSIIFIASIALYILNYVQCNHKNLPGYYIAEIKDLKKVEEIEKIGKKLLTQLYGNKYSDKEVHAFYSSERKVWQIGYFATSDEEFERTGIMESNAGLPVIEINKETGIINRIYLETDGISLDMSWTKS